MEQTKSGIINLERYLLYGMILSMAIYAIPFLRISTEEYTFPIGGLFVPLSCFLLLIRFFAFGKFILNKILILSLFLLYFSIPLSSFFSINIETERIFKLSVFMLLPVLFTSVLTNYKSLKTSLYCIILVGLILAIYGFYGYFTGNVGEDTSKIWWWTYARYWGIHYLASTRNSDIYYIVIPFLVALSLLFFGDLKSILAKTFLIAISLMFFIGIFLSFSRGAWVSIVTTFIVFVFMFWKRQVISFRKGKRLKVIVIATIILSIASFVSYKMLNYYGLYNYFIGKIISTIFPEKAGYYLQERISNEERIEILKTTFEIIIFNPLGVGPDNLRYIYPYYGLGVNHPENNYLHLLAENGVFGFVGYLLFIFYPWIFLYKKIKAGDNGWVEIGMFLALTYLATSYMFNVEVYSFYNWIIHSIIWCSISVNRGKNK
jgi:O-antigen ligase